MKSNNLQQIANSHSRLLPQGTPNDGGIGWWALHSLQIVMDSIAPDRLSASSDKAAKKDQKHWGESVDVERPKGICFSEKFISIVTGVCWQVAPQLQLSKRRMIQLTGRNIIAALTGGVLVRSMK